MFRVATDLYHKYNLYRQKQTEEITHSHKIENVVKVQPKIVESEPVQEVQPETVQESQPVVEVQAEPVVEVQPDVDQ